MIPAGEGANETMNVTSVLWVSIGSSYDSIEEPISKVYRESSIGKWSKDGLRWSRNIDGFGLLFDISIANDTAGMSQRRC